MTKARVGARPFRTTRGHHLFAHATRGPQPVTRALAALGVVVLVSCVATSLGACAQTGEPGLLAAAADPVGQGWAALWDNRLDEAIQFFQDALAKDSPTRRSGAEAELGSARRGLSLAYLARGYERRAIDTVLSLAQGKEAAILDYLMVVWLYAETFTHGKDEESFQEVFESLAARKDLDPLDRRVILAKAGEFALRNGDATTIRKTNRQLSRIHCWSILGPFDNTSWSGLKKDFLEGDQIDLTTAYTGKAGQKFTWRNLPKLSLLGEINFANQLARTAAISAYAGVSIDVHKAGTYLLSISKTGALSLALDGIVLLELDDETKQDEFYHFEVDLPQGQHTLLAKVSNEHLSPRWAAGLWSPTGDRSDGFVLSPLAPGRRSGTPGDTFRRRPLPMVEEVARLAASDTLNATNAYLHLIALIAFDQKEEARQLAEVLDARFPTSAVMRYPIARALARAEDSDGALDQMRRAVDLDPRNAQAMLWLAGEHLRHNLYSRADSLLGVILDRCPDFPSAESSRLRSYQARGMVTEMIEAAERFEHNHPEYPTPYHVLAEHYEKLDQKRSEQLFLQAIKRSARTDEIIALLSRSESREEHGEIRKLLEQIYALVPDNPFVAVQMATAKLRTTDESGMQLAEEAAAAFPQSYDAQFLRAYLAELMISYDLTQRDIAVRYYKEALALRPGEFQTRDKVRTLTFLKPVSEILPPIDLSALREAAPPESAHPGVDGCILAELHRRILFPDGSDYSERAIAIKIYSPEGARRFVSLHTGVNPMFSDLTILEARTIKADGRVVEAQRQLGEVAFESVAPGDIVELHSQASSWSVGTLNQEYWDSHIFEWDVPCLLSQYDLLVPPGRKFQWRLHNLPDSSGIYGSRELGDFVLHTWKRQNILARRKEIYTPDLRDMWAWLDISSIDTWDRIVDWYTDLSSEPSRRDPRVEKKVREILRQGQNGEEKGIQGQGSDQEQESSIRRLYDYVANEVSYENLDFQYSAFIPEPARDVLRMQFGDCKDKVCLLKSMLEAAGVPSWFTLVSPVTDGVTPYLPSPRFSHAMLAISRGSGYQFLDPTAASVPAACLSEAYQGAPALVIARGSDALTSIPFPTGYRADLSVDTKVRVEQAGDLVVARQEVYRSADEIANLRAVPAEEKRRTDYLTAVLGRKNVGVEILNQTWSGLEVGADSVALGYEMRLRDAVSRSGTLRLTKLPWRSQVGESFSMVVAAATREEPLLLYGLQLYEDETLRFQAPSGLRLQGVPETVALESPHGTLSIRYSVNGSTLEARRLLRITGNQVRPAAYPEFKSFLEQVIREQDAMLVLSP